MSEMVRAELYRKAHKPLPPAPSFDDPVFMERLWSGPAWMVAERWGVTERTVVRWRNGYMRPWGGRDRSAIARRGWETRRRST